MKLLKLLYIYLLLPTLLFLIGLAAYTLYKEGYSVSWFGALLTSIPFMVFLIRVMIMQDQARTNFRIRLVKGFSLAGLTLSLIAHFSGFFASEQSLFASSIAFAGTGLLILFVFWFSRAKRADTPSLKLGEKLPELQFSGEQEITSTVELIGKPSVIIFYRGSWCPFCVAQIKEVVAEYQQAIYKGVQFVLISPQPDMVTKKLAQKFDVPFMFLTDVNNAAAKKLNLVDAEGLPLDKSDQGVDNNTVYPTVIVTDKRGDILYCDKTASYSARPDAKEYLPLVVDMRTAGSYA